MLKSNQYQLPLKYHCERVFNFEGSYWQCSLLDSKKNLVVGVATEYGERKTDFAKASRKLCRYLSNNPDEFPKILKKLRSSKRPDHLADVVNSINLD